MAAVVHQLRTNPGLFDGLYGYCGYAWRPDGTIYNYNATSLGHSASRRRGCHFGDTPLFIPIEPPAKSTGGCRQMTVSPTARRELAAAAQEVRPC